MIRLTCCLAAMLASCALAASGQSFPTKPVHIVVSMPPGGTADRVARTLADALVDTWGQPVIVENKPGAGSILAVAQLQRSTADGYTLLMVAPSFVMNPMLNSMAHYEPTKDFTPVAELVTSPLVIATNSGSPAKSLKDLTDLARAKPGAVVIAGVGPNTAEHMVTEMLRLQSKVDWVFAPYNGSAPAVTAALGGHVTAVIASYADVAAHIASGRLRALAVGTRERLEKLEGVPTIAELGYSLVDSTLWFGIVAPAGTPADVVEKIGLDMVRAVNLPRVRERLVAQNLYPVLGPEPFDIFLASQSQRYASLIKRAGFRN